MCYFRKKLALYDEYVTYGAFPELVDIIHKRTYLRSNYQTTLL